MSTPSSNLGKYQLVKELGRGGMGAVWQAYDPDLERAVAIKLLAPHLVWEKDFVERFLREARAAARLHHPNIIAIHDVGQDKDNYFFVMDYLLGPSLKQRVEQKGRLAPAEALTILRQMASALDYAHSKGLVHRDVKPANVMFDEHGQAVLTDFGIVKAASESKLTATGSSIGTPHYMAPEQVQGKEVDAHTDQYALGIVVFELLTGRVPFDADSTTAILFKQVHEPPPPVSAWCPACSLAVEAVLNRALSKSPADRYASCGEFVTALEQAFGLPSAQPQLTTQPVTPATERITPLGQTIAEPTPASELGPTLRHALAPARRGVPRWAWAVGVLVVLICLAGGFAAATGWLGKTGMKTAPATSTTALVLTVAANPPTATYTPVAVVQPSITPSQPTQAPRLIAVTLTSAPTLTPQPTATPSCPSISGPFTAVWNAVQSQIGCATGNVIGGLAAEENFRGGIMFWREPIDVAQALVVFNNGTWRIFKHSPYVEGSPEFSCPDANTPSQCPPTPKRGFGMMWCDTPEIRSGLGKATECEKSYQGSTQQFEQGFMFRTASGVTYVFYNNARWERR